MEKRDQLKRWLEALDDAALQRLALRQLRLVSDKDSDAGNVAFLKEVLVTAYERRRSQREVRPESDLCTNYCADYLC